MDATLQAKVKDCKKRNAWDEVITLLEHAREETPKDVYLLRELAFSYSRAQQYEDAIEVYEHLSKLQPDTAQWLYGLGYQYYAQQQFEKALPHFERALELHPEYIAVLYRKGYALSQLGNERRGEALTALEKCRKVFQSLSDGEQKDRELKHYAKACFQQGKLFTQAGNLRLAEKRLLEAVELQSQDANVLYNLGKVYVQLERYEDAIDHLKAAKRLSARPQHYIIAYLGRAYLGAEALKEARQLYEDMRHLIRKRAYILRDVGELYARLEEWDLAETVLRKAVKQDYRNHNGHFQLGVVLEQKGKYREAAQEFRKAQELRQKHYNRRFPEAEASLQALLSANPELDSESKQLSVPQSKSGRPVARVKVYFDDKGYGFLESQEQGTDYFFHITDVMNRETVSEGEYFVYDIEETEKGSRAVNLESVSSQGK